MTEEDKKDYLIEHGEPTTQEWTEKTNLSSCLMDRILFHKKRIPPTKIGLWEKDALQVIRLAVEERWPFFRQVTERNVNGKEIPVKLSYFSLSSYPKQLLTHAEAKLK